MIERLDAWIEEDKNQVTVETPIDADGTQIQHYNPSTQPDNVISSHTQVTESLKPSEIGELKEVVPESPNGSTIPPKPLVVATARVII